MLRDLLINGLAAWVMTPRTVRRWIYQAYGIHVKSKNISPRCFFGGRAISVGAGTFINYGCFLENHVAIGSNCAIGMDVLICSSSHRLGGSERRAGEVATAPVAVGDGCWIGARAVILPGITIGDGCVIAAGAVVTADCEPNGLYAGVPARRVRDLAAGQPAGGGDSACGSC